MTNATASPESPRRKPEVSEPSWARRCDAIAHAHGFQNFILGVIVLNAIVIGLETSATVMERYGRLLLNLNVLFQVIFIVEITIRLLVHGRRPLRFFRDGWNVFDFTIVVLSLLPVQGAFATVGRLARLLRVTRLVSMSTELRLIIATMFRSIPSMGHVLTLLSLLLYIYGVAGYYLFHTVDPQRWGTLGDAMLSLFQVLTLEGWAEMQGAIMEQGGAYRWAWLYFASFIVFAVFVVVNLFIAVVINNLDSARKEAEAAALGPTRERQLLEQIATIETQMSELRRTIEMSVRK